MKKLTTVLTTLFVLTASTALAAPSEGDLKKRFEARYPEIRELKSKGVIGETDGGYVEFVKDRDKDAADVVKDENDDRKALYALIAEKEKTEPEVVAKRNAKRNFERAKDGEYLKEDGNWRKKGEEKK
jgi:uncharacterized protein YdbL (DUF1318 family)